MKEGDHHHQPEHGGDLELGNASSIDRSSLQAVMESVSLSKLTHYGGVTGIVKGVDSSIEHGLSKHEMDTGFVARRRMYGANVLPQMQHKSFLRLFLEALRDPIIIILIFASVISISLQSAFHDPSHAWYEGTAIMVSILIVGSVTAFNNYTQEQQFRALNAVERNKRVKVTRAAEKREIFSNDLQVGDIVILEKGDMIPADGLCTSSFSLLVDESAMTGESDMLEKDPETAPFMLSGCTICDGVGTMVVVCVGADSQWGRTLAKLQQVQEMTPLQKKLGSMATFLGKLGVGGAVLTFIALSAQWAYDQYAVNKVHFEWENLLAILEFFIISVTIIVVAVPEGLPLAVTISLAYSMKKMMLDNNLVRKLQACETMGGATNICSDKTGTLTTNQMTVLEGWIQGRLFKGTSQFNASPNIFGLLAESLSVNSNAYIEQRGVKSVHIGNKTECAMLQFIQQMGANYEEIRRAAKIHKIFSFTSDRKRMGTIVSVGQSQHRLFCKGASEILLDLSSHYIAEDGNMHPIDPRVKTEIALAIEQMALTGLRTIAVCYKDLVPGEQDKDDRVENPVRPEVPLAITKCQQAGITVRMVTGDNISTATTIAKECGLLTDSGLAMEGPAFRKLSPDQMDQIVPRLQVLARSSPLDKHMLVSWLKAKGEVVAVTGDGTNDAPALREAHVGLAMGIAGTDVAKEASVMWGRCVFDNIRKFLQFQLTVNFVALCTAFIAAVTDRGLPLKTVQLLWVNLIMDTLAALALGTETPTPDLLNRKPYGLEEPLISNVMKKNIFLHGIWQLGLLLGLLYGGPKLLNLPYDHHAFPEEENKLILDTIIFNTFVFLQLFNEFNARIVIDKRHNPFYGMHKNYVFNIIFVVTVALQVVVIQYGDVFLETRSLSLQHWSITIALGTTSLVMGVLIRFIPIDKYFPKPSLDPKKEKRVTEITPLLSS